MGTVCHDIICLPCPVYFQPSLIKAACSIQMATALQLQSLHVTSFRVYVVRIIKDIASIFLRVGL